MIVTFTDFGPSGPYLGQMEAVLHQYAPEVKVIRLIDDAPIGNPQFSSYLLAALSFSFPENTIFLSVVDPGVGGSRIPVVLRVNQQYFVGPDNGSFNTIAVQSDLPLWYKIIWQPTHCSSSFHGRDVFAPVAAMMAQGKDADKILEPYSAIDLKHWKPDLNKLIYFDHYGNAITGFRYRDSMQGKRLQVGNFILENARTFCEAQIYKPFWYKNSMGLVEIAVNQGNAQSQLRLELGQSVDFI